MKVSNCEILAREGIMKGSCCDDCHNNGLLVEQIIYDGEEDRKQSLICCKVKAELEEIGMIP